MVTFTAAQLKQHRSRKDAWIAIHGKVYNITAFLKEVTLIYTFLFYIFLILF